MIVIAKTSHERRTPHDLSFLEKGGKDRGNIPILCDLIVMIVTTVTLLLYGELTQERRPSNPLLSSPFQLKFQLKLN